MFVSTHKKNYHHNFKDNFIHRPDYHNDDDRKDID